MKKIIKNGEYAKCPFCKIGDVIYRGGYWVCEKNCLVVDLTSEHHLRIKDGYKEIEVAQQNIEEV